MEGRLFSGATVAAALVFAVGCGSSSKPAGGTSSQPATTTTATESAEPPEPKGRLSAGEYSALIRAYKVGQGVRHPSPRKSMALFRKTCQKLAAAPGTELILSERRACARVKRFVAALLAFTTQKDECNKASQAGDASCYGELFSRLARATHTSIASSREVNSALRRRRISGRCSTAVGLSTPADLRNAATLGHDARRASQLLYAHYDLAAYVAAVHAVEADIKNFDDGVSDKQQLARLRRCPHGD